MTREPEMVFEVDSSLHDLADALGALGAFLARHEVEPRPTFQGELIFEELVTNAARHGYGGKPGHCVEVLVRLEPDDLVLVVSDDAPPFNPLHQAAPDTPESLADASVGGLGIMLVRKAARRIDYERVDGRNRLVVAIGRRETPSA
jgi:serine/threonine-protein kinase RsbW